MAWPVNAAEVRRGLAAGLRLVRNARLELSVPLMPGAIAPGLHVLPGTVAHVTLVVSEGEADFAASTVRVVPALDGPLFTSVQGLRFDSDGRPTLRIKGLPDVKVGPQLPVRLGDLADELERGGRTLRVPIRVFGLRLVTVNVDAQDATDAAQALAAARVPGTPDFEAARLTVAEAELCAGRIDVGPHGADILEGTKVRIEGTAEHLRVRGVFHFCGARAQTGHLAVEDAAAEVNVDATLHLEDGGLRVFGRAQIASGRTGRARASRGNGDFLEVDESGLDGATVEVEDLRADCLSSLLKRLPLRKLRFDSRQMEAKVAAGLISLDGAERQTELVVGPGRFAGAFRSELGEVKLSGEVDVDARIRELHSPARQMTLHMTNAHATGTGTLHFASGRGVHLEGRTLMVRSDLQHVHAVAWDGRNSLTAVQGSTAQVKVTELQVLPNGELRIVGRGDLDLVLDDIELNTHAIELRGQKARLKVHSALSLDSRGEMRIWDGRVLMEADHLFARAQAGRAAVHLHGRYKVKAMVDEVSMTRDGVVVQWGDPSTLAIDVHEGELLLANDVRLGLRRGTKLRARLRQLLLAAGGARSLEGALSVHARFGSTEDLAKGAALAPLQLAHLSAGSESLQFSAARAVLHPDGRFEVNDAEVGVSAHIEDMSGTLPEL